MNYLSTGESFLSGFTRTTATPDHTGSSHGFPAPIHRGARFALLGLALGLTSSVLAALNPPDFDHARGFYSAPFALALSLNPADSSPTLQIRYTLDGTPPSATVGQLYSGPLSVDTTKVVRAVVFDSANTASVSTSVTSTYLFPQDVLAQPRDIPSTTDPRFTSYPAYPRNTYDVGNNQTRVHDYEMDPEVLNNSAYSPLALGSLTSIPTMSLAVDLATMFGPGGFYDDESEVPCSLEILYPANPGSDQQLNGSIQGHSSIRLKRSLRLSFSSSFGPSKLTSNFLQGAPVNGASAASSFDTVVLRAGNNRSWARAWNPDSTSYAEDQWYRDSQIALTGVGSHGTFVHLYINGLYWGLYNPAERPDESFAASYLGGKKGNYFSLKEDGRLKGDPARWNYLVGPLIAKDMTAPANYAELTGYLDVNQFSDYLILCWYAGINDWPNNNWWASNRNDVPGPVKFYNWDGEWSWDRGNPFDPSLNGESPHGAWVHPAFRAGSTDASFQAKIWRSIRVSSDFMTTFADHVYSAVSTGALSDINSRLRWNRLNLYIEDAVIAESIRWGDAITASTPRTRDVDWQRAVDNVYDLMGGNGARFIAALRAQNYYPSIDAPLFNRPGGPVATGTQVSLGNPNAVGTLYYTTNGADPRLSGGAIEATAQVYEVPLTISATTPIKARVLNGTEWSALAAATFDPTATNTAPVVAAVGPIAVTLPSTVTLNATATDDGLPSEPLSLQWTASGPATVTFSSPNALETTAAFTVAGSYVLHLIASDGSLQAQSDVPIFVSPAPPPAGGVLSSFTLIDADTDLPVPGYETLPEGAVLDLTTLPTNNLNIRANTSPVVVGSVRFAFNNKSNFRTESGAPYALYADTNGNYNAWVPPPGNYTLQGTPYSGAAGTGSAGVPLTIHFSVIRSAPNDTTPPSQPGSLTASNVTTTTATLNWVASTDNAGVTGYQVSRDGVLLATVTTTTYPDSGLTLGTTYAYAVVAMDAASNASSAATLNVTTLSAADTEAPGAPGALSFTDVTSGSVTVNWSAATDNVGVTGYRMSRNGVVLTTVAGLSFQDSALTPSTTYSYSVVALDGSSNESASSDASITTAVAPPLTTIRVNAGGPAYVDSASHTWSADTGFNTGKTSNEAGTVVGTPDPTLYKTIRFDESPAPELQYTFAAPNGSYTARLHFAETAASGRGPGLRVFHVDLQGVRVFSDVDIFTQAGGAFKTLVLESPIVVTGGQVTIRLVHKTNNPRISAIEILPAEGPPPPDTVPPSQPASPTASNVTMTTATLHWVASTDNVGVTGYNVFRDGTLLGTVTTTTYPDNGLTLGTHYLYSVVAVDAAHNSSSAAELEVTTASEPDSEPPSAPGTLSFTNATSNSLTVNWPAATDNVGVTGYQIARDGVVLTTVTTLSFTDSSLSPSTTYAYSVIALDAESNASAASEAMVATLAPVPLPTIRVNAGGPTYTDSAGHTWSADANFNTGKASTEAGTVLGTPDPTLYKTVRFDESPSPELLYSFPVPNGAYKVRLHFAETASSGSGMGKRVFHIDVQGARAFENVDIYNQAGGAFKALVLEKAASVSNGQIQIRFIHKVNNPRLSAIEIVPE